MENSSVILKKQETMNFAGKRSELKNAILSEVT